MKKKRLIAFLAALCVGMSLAACERSADGVGKTSDENDIGKSTQTEQPAASSDNPHEPPKQEHTHAYDKKNTAEKYLASAATCTAKAKYYYSCECGAAGTDTFEYGNKSEHKYSKVHYGATVDYFINIVGVNSIYKDGVLVETTQSETLNYIYKEQHIAMLVYRLSSDKFCAKILEEMGGKYKAAVEAVSVTLDDGSKAIELNSESVSEEAKSNFISCLELVKTSLWFTGDYAINPHAFSMHISVEQDFDFASLLLSVAKEMIPEEAATRMIVPSSTSSLRDGNGTVTEYRAECQEESISYCHKLNEEICEYCGSKKSENQ